MDHDYTNHIMPRKVRSTERGYGGPIVVILMAVLIVIGLTVSAFAQTSGSSSISGAATNTEVETLAVAGINNYGQKAGEENRTYQEVATAPSLGGLALGGGHPCAYSPATFQVSVIGSGAGAGGMKVDSACMLMVMGAAGDAKAYKAAQLMLAARDPDACVAMEAAGLVDCTTKAEARAAAKKDWSKSSKTPEVVKASWGAKCEKVGNTIKFRPSSAAARDAELANCKARF